MIFMVEKYIVFFWILLIANPSLGMYDQGKKRTRSGEEERGVSSKKQKLSSDVGNSDTQNQLAIKTEAIFEGNYKTDGNELIRLLSDKEAFSNITSLTVIRILRPENIQLIVGFLEKSKILKILVLRDNYLIGNCKKGNDLLASLIKHDSPLRKLDLSGCYIQREGQKAIFKNLAQNYHLKTLYLDASAFCAWRELIDALNKNTSLVHLFVGSKSPRDNRALEKDLALAIEKNRSLIELSFYNVRTSFNELDSILGNNSTLQCLSLCGNRPTDSDLEKIKNGLKMNSTLTDFRIAYSFLPLENDIRNSPAWEGILRTLGENTSLLNFDIIFLDDWKLPPEVTNGFMEPAKRSAKRYQPYSELYLCAVDCPTEVLDIIAGMMFEVAHQKEKKRESTYTVLPLRLERF